MRYMNSYPSLPEKITLEPFITITRKVQPTIYSSHVNVLYEYT